MTDHTNLIARLRQGALEYYLLEYRDLMTQSADALEALQAENARIGIDAAKQIVVLRSSYNTLKKLIDEGNIHERILSAGIEQEREISELRSLT